MIKNPITGYILAGGKSSRMGEDKGLLILNEIPIIQHVINQLHPCVNKIVIVSNNPAYEIFNLPVIPDQIKNIGPAGGIHAALSHSTTDKLFIIGCDMPFVNTTSINYIIENNAESQITVPLNQNHVEPLFGVYEKSCVSEWERLIKSGNIKLQELVKHFSLKTIHTENIPGFDTNLFVNINTKMELEYAKKHF